MAILSTDFQNEIINETINTKRKYFMTDNDDGTVSFTDNTSYTQVGTEYGAEEIIEEREQINQHTNVIGSDEFNPESSYSAGDYFIYNNKLCKALSAISAGAALSLGSNYQVTSIENELSGLNGKKLDAYFSPENEINLYDNGRYVCLSAKSQVSNINDTVVANAIGSWCFIISFVYDDTGVQFITSLFSSSAGERTIYKRSKTSGTWSKWSAINSTP